MILRPSTNFHEILLKAEAVGAGALTVNVSEEAVIHEFRLCLFETRVRL